MKKFILTLLTILAMATVTVSAQAPIRIKNVVCGKQVDKLELQQTTNNPKLKAAHEARHVSEQAQTIPPVLKDSPNYDDYEGETIRIYFDVIWDEDYYTPSALSLFNGVNSIFVYLDQLTGIGSPARVYVTVPAEELPDGDYAAWVRFYRPDWGYDLCAINEVNLPKDVTEDNPLIFDTNEIKYAIEFHPVLPNGEELKFDIIRYIDQAPWYETVSEDGNVSLVAGDTYLVHDDYEFTLNSTFGYNYVPEDNPWPNSWTLGVNDLSDKFKYFMTINVETKSGEKLHINMNSVGTTYTDVRNDTGFQSFSLPIKHTPAYKGIEEGLPVARFDAFNMVCGANEGYSGIQSNRPIEEILIWQSKDCSIKTLMSSYCLAQFDYVDKYVETWEEDGQIYEWVEYYPYGIYSPIVFPIDGKDIYVTTESYMEKEGESRRPYPGHERFSYTSNEIGCEIGNTAPILKTFSRVLQVGEGMYRNIIRINNCYGRLGEDRSIDVYLTKKSATFNGEVVCSEEDNFDQWVSDWGFENHDPGTLVYTFVDDNVEVEGVKGRNVTNMRVQWLGKDMTAPTLTMLMTRDANDVITDRFDSVEGAVIDVAACDDNSGYTDNGFEQIVVGAQVEVEYAPFGTEEWEALYTEEISDLSSYTFGSFYRASLDEVDRPCENGWYDLRVTATDAAGNTQQQVISPAFHVEKLVSGLIPTTTTSEESPATYFNLQGIQIANPSNGLFIRKRGNTVEKIRL